MGGVTRRHFRFLRFLRVGFCLRCIQDTPSQSGNIVRARSKSDVTWSPRRVSVAIIATAMRAISIACSVATPPSSCSIDLLVRRMRITTQLRFSARSQVTQIRTSSIGSRRRFLTHQFRPTGHSCRAHEKERGDDNGVMFEYERRVHSLRLLLLILAGVCLVVAGCRGSGHESGRRAGNERQATPAALAGDRSLRVLVRTTIARHPGAGQKQSQRAAPKSPGR